MQRLLPSGHLVGHNDVDRTEVHASCRWWCLPLQEAAGPLTARTRSARRRTHARQLLDTHLESRHSSSGHKHLRTWLSSTCPREAPDSRASLLLRTR